MPASEESLDSVSDFDLLQLTASGDIRGFSAFVNRHQGAVFRHACCLVGSRADAEDILQETFLSALKAAGQFRGDASGRTWLFQIARNAAMRHVDRQKAYPEGDVTLEALALQAGWGGSNPETLAMLAEDHQRLRLALSELPREEREVLLLRQWENLSGEEVAALLNLTLSAMKSRLHRARIHLGALLRSGSARKEK